MLITDANAMMGTVFDDTGEMAMRLNIGDCLTFGSFIPSFDSLDVPVRLPMLWHVIDKQGSRLKLLSYFFFEHTGYWPLMETQVLSLGKKRTSATISTTNTSTTASVSVNESNTYHRSKNQNIRFIDNYYERQAVFAGAGGYREHTGAFKNRQRRICQLF